jgi:hypothetical protein
MLVSQLDMKKEILTYFVSPNDNGIWFLKCGRLKPFRRNSVEFRTVALQTLRDYSFEKYVGVFGIEINTKETITCKEFDKDTWRRSDGSKLGIFMTIEEVIEYLKLRPHTHQWSFPHPMIKVYRNPWDRANK